MMGLRYTLAALLLLFQSVSCAVRPVEASHSRIVGGINAMKGDWPWQVSVMYDAVHVCGGSLIDETHILSAAHCFPSDHDWGTYMITLGAYQLQVPDSNMQTRGVISVATFPGYVDGGSGDIAVVTLDRAVSFSDYIKPIPLPCSSTVFPVGMKCMITGWGHIGMSAALPSPMTLQAAEVPLIGQNTCKCLYSINPSTTHTQDIMTDMMCAGLVSGGRDACQGDSGGPLSCKVNGVYYLAGITSWGDDCGAPNRVGVYTLTSVYINWILGHAPGAQTSCLTIDIPPASEVQGGCIDADGKFHANGASTFVLVAASLPFYFLTVYLLSAF